MFMVIIVLIVHYLMLKNEIRHNKISETNSKLHLQNMFIFVGFLSGFQVLYLSNAYINYTWDVVNWLKSSFTFFLFLVIVLVIDNCIQIKLLLSRA